MKKVIIVILCIISCCFLFLAGCSDEKQVAKISIENYVETEPLKFEYGESSFEGYLLVVTYENGEVKKIAIEGDMISEADKLKFYQEGNHSIVLTYKGASVTVNISVSRKVFPDGVQFNEITTPYTGQPIVITVEGEIPNGTEIIYPQGNSFVSAGSYGVTAILQCEGYVSKTLTSKVNITKAEYDLSSAQLYDEVVDYDKNSHSLQVKGKISQEMGGQHEQAEIPEGVRVSYTITKIKDGNGNDISQPQEIEGNSAIDAGTYLVSANFKGDSSNYEQIPSSTALLVINQAVYDTSGVEMLNRTVKYNGEKATIEVEDGYNLPSSVEIEYQIKKIKNASGQAVEEEYTDGNGAFDVGVYEVKANFIVIGKQAINYKTNPSQKIAYLTIIPANYEQQMEKVFLDYQSFVYGDGEYYDIVLDGQLPSGVTPKFTLTDKADNVIVGEEVLVTKEYLDDDGKIYQTTNFAYRFTVKEQGEYTCSVSFSHSNENYEQIDQMVCTVFVESFIKHAEIDGVSSPETIVLGSFNCSNYKVLITDANGVLEKIELKEEMFYSEEEKAKVSTVESHTVKFIYSGLVFEFEIEVVESV